MNEMKAWRVFCPNIVGEPWHYDDIIVYAETREKAKAMAWANNESYIKDAEVPNEEYSYWREFSPKYREIKYTDLRVSRCKEEDKIEFDGKLVTKKEAKEYQWMKERDEYAKSLADNHPNQIAVVFNGSYGSYWGSNRSGYSSDIINAGIYTTKEAYAIVRHSDYSRQESVILVSAESINEEIDDRINVLQKQIDVLNSKRI